MDKFKLFFFKSGILKITPQVVKKWAKQNNFELLKYATENGDFWCRKEVAKNLVNFDYSLSFPLLRNLLHDKVFTVVENSIETLNIYNLPHEIKKEIEDVISFWENRHEDIKANWDKPTKFSPGITIDKSQMKRLAQLKDLLAKPKGSMSIG
jgi:hypothetical protein